MEVTYPIAPATGVCVIFLTGQAVSAVLILISGVMEQPLSQEYYAVQVHGKVLKYF